MNQGVEKHLTESTGTVISLGHLRPSTSDASVRCRQHAADP